MKVLITGSNSDISKSLGEILLERGDSIVFTCSSKESHKSAKEYWEKHPNKDRIDFCIFNFSAPNTNMEQLVKFELDSVVLNAWKKVDELKDFHEFTDEDVDSELLENIKGNVLLLRSLIPGMVERKLGRILYISSVVASAGTSKYGLYCLGKSAIEGLIKNIAVDYGKHNITANTLRPGIIKTQRTKRFWEREFYAKRMSKGIPMNKLGEPVHIAQSCLTFLMEDTYISGSSLNVSGGLPLISTAGAIKEEK
ncbi:MAG: SDR family oxidoreductase [Bacteriovoracaceae bacterium]|nr:SDR family oxidoreductase [Bacteriovoracaceae bacterium]